MEKVGEILLVHLARYLVYAKLVYHRLGGTMGKYFIYFLRQEPKLNLHYPTFVVSKGRTQVIGIIRATNENL